MPCFKARSIAQADHVICISENTRRDVLTTYDIPEERVSVTLLGHDSLAAILPAEPAEEFRKRVTGSHGPYILFVGIRDRYKNFNGLLHAYASSRWLRSNFNLLCFGGGEFTAAERLLISGCGVAGRVHHVGGADTVLAGCYAHAALFVYPSLYEGFGIPTLEAMSLDCPVACSNTSSFPEVVGDAARLFDPTSVESIREALEAVLNSAEVASSLIRRGSLRRTRFTWQRCAASTVEVYRRLCGW